MHDFANVVFPVDDGDRVRARARLPERLLGHTEVRELGRYRLVEMHDRKLDREVALKLLHEDALRRPLRARRQLFCRQAQPPQRRARL